MPGKKHTVYGVAFTHAHSSWVWRCTTVLSWTSGSRRAATRSCSARLWFPTTTHVQVLGSPPSPCRTSKMPCLWVSFLSLGIVMPLCLCFPLFSLHGKAKHSAILWLVSKGRIFHDPWGLHIMALVTILTHFYRFACRFRFRVTQWSTSPESFSGCRARSARIAGLWRRRGRRLLHDIPGKSVGDGFWVNNMEKPRQLDLNVTFVFWIVQNVSFKGCVLLLWNYHLASSTVQGKAAE